MNRIPIWLLLAAILVVVLFTSAHANGPICPGAGVIPCTNPGAVYNYPVYLTTVQGGGASLSPETE